ncbi:hypothetical protein vseg_015514 [Gypsophila vaccaria]
MSKIRDPKQLNPKPGQIQFRLLCDNSTAGGLIGSNGAVVKSLERDTSSRITVGPTSSLRVVAVLADSFLSRSLDLGGAGGAHFRVSPAQDALVRVFDRVLEVEAEERGGVGADGDVDVDVGGDVVKCRMVVGPGMMGAVMGKGGGRISKVIKESGAFVRVLPFHFRPPGVSPSDELIQITGGSLSVKKALVIISQFIQQKVVESERGAPEATSSRYLDQSMKTGICNAQVNNAANGVVAEVMFKLICPYRAAGFVIGPKGKKLKSIEDETRACIKFSAPDMDNHARVATISSIENRESQYSFAQNATVRVFTELVSSEEANRVTARLLVLPYQSDLLSGGEVSILSTIHNDTGAALKIMELDHLPVGATAVEKALQIDGDCPNVQLALFQVTWILRERVFDSSLCKDSLPLLPHRLFNLPSQGDKVSAITDKMNNCRVSKPSNGSLPPTLPHSQLASGSNLTTRTGRTGHPATAKGGSSFGSDKKSFIVTNTKLELAVREDVFSAVYGENGNNLARLRQISGATVEVHDPSSGSDGKVIISGTHDQTLVAQSLLQAFLMSA